MTKAPSWLHQIPKVELHLHLEGAVRPQLLRYLAAKNGVELPPAETSAEEPAYRYSTFLEFLDCFKTACSVLTTPEDFATVAEELLAELAAQRVFHAEIFLSPVIHERRGIPAIEILPRLHEVALKSRETQGLSCLFLFDAVRQWGVESAWQSLELANRCRHWSVVGIGIGGDEASIPAATFADIYRHARETGLRRTIHAGEACGPESIAEALRHLDPERIGHGLRAVEDPRLVEEIRARGIMLDISLTSNLRTGVWHDLESHPARQLFAAGIPISLNTDDPALFGTTLTEEYSRGAKLLDLSPQEMQRLILGALENSFLPSEEKARQRTAFLSRFPPAE